MDVYVNQIVGSGSAHDLFYTNANVISAYKNYVKTFVGRYSSNPVIFGWELGERIFCKSSKYSSFFSQPTSLGAREALGECNQSRTSHFVDEYPELPPEAAPRRQSQHGLLIFRLTSSLSIQTTWSLSAMKVKNSVPKGKEGC